MSLKLFRLLNEEDASVCLLFLQLPLASKRKTTSNYDIEKMLNDYHLRKIFAASTKRISWSSLSLCSLFTLLLVSTGHEALNT